MSVSGGTETHRAEGWFDAPVGGTTSDVVRLVASEDRRITGIALDDTGGTSEAVVEASFSSTPRLGNNNSVDSARGSSILMVSGGLHVDDLNITWNAGEEIHLHSRNNSGNAEEGMVVVYYEEV